MVFCQLWTPSNSHLLTLSLQIPHPSQVSKPKTPDNFWTDSTNYPPTMQFTVNPNSKSSIRLIFSKSTPTKKRITFWNWSWSNRKQIKPNKTPANQQGKSPNVKSESWMHLWATRKDSELPKNASWIPKLWIFVKNKPSPQPMRFSRT